MRSFCIDAASISELAELPGQLPDSGMVWISCTRDAFKADLPQVQAALLQLAGTQLMDLHVSDLLNAQLPSHYDYTSVYDVLVFRRLFMPPPGQGGPPAPRPVRKGGVPILKRIDTRPVGFAVFDRVLLSVHPDDTSVRDAYIARLIQHASADAKTAAARLPTCPADLMLRLVSLMVDGFLDLRREISHQLDHWQTELTNPSTRFTNWRALLDARQSLHHLDEICDDQHAAIKDWTEALGTWPAAQTPAEQRERDLLQVRSRDVLEHIERMVHHLRRMEQNSETAIQIHFSVQGSRTNDIMRTLTVLTAIFLPLNLITGFFGMNFEFMPLIHREGAFWWIVGAMIAVALSTSFFFWRKRFLAKSGK
jgi:Mg2+ and Co2+ transporter CorA